MEKKNTKQDIMDAALGLFSQKGYNAVSVEEIAGEVGIKAPSLYKHYKNKKAIFDAIFDEMECRYNKQIENMQMHFSDAAKDKGMFAKISEDGLVEKVRELVQYSLQDEYVSKFRRMLTIEQFRSEELGQLYTKRYVEYLVNYHKELFDELIGLEILKNEDSYIMALQYVSPVCVFLGICDREPERKKEVMDLLERHIRQFNKVYGVKKD